MITTSRIPHQDRYGIMHHLDHYRGYRVADGLFKVGQTVSYRGVWYTVLNDGSDPDTVTLLSRDWMEVDCVPVGSIRHVTDSIECLVDRLLGESGLTVNEAGEQAKHSQCKFYAAIPNREGYGRCSKYNKDVQGDGPVCGDFETRDADATVAERRRMVFRDIASLRDHLVRTYGDDPDVLDAALAFADNRDHRWGKYLRRMQWDGAWVGPNKFLEQALAIGDVGGFGPDTAVDLTDTYGPDAEYKISRDGGPEVRIRGSDIRADVEPGDFGTSDASVHGDTVVLAWGSDRGAEV